MVEGERGLELNDEIYTSYYYLASLSTTHLSVNITENGHMIVPD